MAGDVLVSNFNAQSNVQGTGTTIVQVAPNGTQTLFAHITDLPAGMSCPGGIGLTTALDILPGGYVVVGSLPSKAGGLPKGDPAGCLIVLNHSGAVAETISNANIVGPWDMAVASSASTATWMVRTICMAKKQLAYAPLEIPNPTCDSCQMLMTTEPSSTTDAKRPEARRPAETPC